MPPSVWRGSGSPRPGPAERAVAAGLPPVPAPGSLRPGAGLSLPLLLPDVLLSAGDTRGVSSYEQSVLAVRSESDDAWEPQPSTRAACNTGGCGTRFLFECLGRGVPADVRILVAVVGRRGAANAAGTAKRAWSLGGHFDPHDFCTITNSSPLCRWGWHAPG